jgi:hypothetical protein
MQVMGFMEPAGSSDETAFVCRICGQPISPGTGVLAAPRLAPRALRAGPPLPVFGPVNRIHVVCVPPDHRIETRF